MSSFKNVGINKLSYLPIVGIGRTWRKKSRNCKNGWKHEDADRQVQPVATDMCRTGGGTEDKGTYIMHQTCGWQATDR